MNIFVTNAATYLAVRDLDDKRLVKMVLETCQILSTVMTLRGAEGPYKPTHKNHPCTIWANDPVNFHWLVVYFLYICQEYTYRFNKVHACFRFINLFKDYSDELFKIEVIVDGPMEFVNCTKFKDEADTVLAYRLALVDKWANDKRPPKWTKRKKPEWAENIFKITLEDVQEV